MKVATGRAYKVKTPRKQCPACKSVYMQIAYILQQNEGKKNWIRIGKYCSACRHFIQDETKNKKDS